MFSRHSALAVLSLLLIVAAGCESYVVPGQPADFAAFGVSGATRQALTDGSVQRQLDRKPLAGFPTALAVARVQGPGYRRGASESYGKGAYSIVTTREVEKDEHFQRLGRLPMVTGVAGVSRLLLPPNLNSDLELRSAAAAMRADMLLVYTFDTAITQDDAFGLLSVVTLGLAPTQVIKARTTASALLLDTRNGYVYGLAQTSSDGTRLAAYWGCDLVRDAARRAVEEQAFEEMLSSFERVWGQVLTQYAAGPPAGRS